MGMLIAIGRFFISQMGWLVRAAGGSMKWLYWLLPFLVETGLYSSERMQSYLSQIVNVTVGVFPSAAQSSLTFMNGLLPFDTLASSLIVFASACVSMGLAKLTQRVLHR